MQRVAFLFSLGIGMELLERGASGRGMLLDFVSRDSPQQRSCALIGANDRRRSFSTSTAVWTRS